MATTDKGSVKRPRLRCFECEQAGHGAADCPRVLGRAVFGLFELPGMATKINRLLKPHGLKLKVKRDRRRWGDQVEVSVERIDPGRGRESER